MKFLLLAKQAPSNTLPNNVWCFWWLPNGGGFTASVPHAGRYPEQIARAIAKTSGDTAFAIPVAVATKGGRTFVPADEYESLLAEAAAPRTVRQ